MLRGPLRSSALRQAAAELGRLPEFAEARQLCAISDVTGALRPLERACDVMQHVPMPAMQLVTQGALAQALRAAGLLVREADVWKRILSTDLDASLRLHALNGLITCNLHRGRSDDALVQCNEALSLCEPRPDALRWEASFLIQRALAQSGKPSDAAEQLEHALSRLGSVELSSADEDEAGAIGAATCSARLLLGDQLVRLDRGEEAQQMWNLSLAPDGISVAALDSLSEESAQPVSEGEQDRVLRAVAAHGRLGKQAMVARELDEADGQLKAALKLCELHLPRDAGNEHPLLHHSIGALASCFAAKLEPIAAEGLFRSAIDGLLGGAGGQPRTLMHARLVTVAMEDFAVMLSDLEWNNKPVRLLQETPRHTSSEPP